MVPTERLHRHNRILVTDDDPNWRSGLREALEPRGYETLEAASGEQAIEVVHDFRPDVIILDLELPQISGLETLRILRQEIEDLMPTIIVSSRIDDEKLTRALELKATTVLDKMSGVHRIVYTVRRVIERYYYHE